MVRQFLCCVENQDIVSEEFTTSSLQMLPSVLAEVRLMHRDSRKDPLARITATRWTELSPRADVKHWATLASFLLQRTERSCFSE